MTVTVNLPDDAARRLAAEATRRGITVDQVIAELAATLPGGAPGGPEQSGKRRLEFVAMGASTSGRRAAEAQEMLAEGFGRDCGVLLVDTGVFLAAADRHDPDHAACRGLVEEHAGPLIPAP